MTNSDRSNTNDDYRSILEDRPAEIYVAWSGFMRDDRPGPWVKLSPRDGNVDITLGDLYVSLSPEQASKLRDALALVLEEVPG